MNWLQMCCNALKVFKVIKINRLSKLQVLKLVQDKAMIYKYFEINVSHLGYLDMIHNQRKFWKEFRIIERTYLH
jgi:hypothetical protein